MDGEHQKIARQDQQLPAVAVGTTLAGSAPIYFAKAASGNVIALAGETFTTLTWWGSHDGTDYVPIKSAGTAATTPMAAPCGDVIPAACSAYPYLKAVGDQAGHIQVCLKG